MSTEASSETSSSESSPHLTWSTRLWNYLVNFIALFITEVLSRADVQEAAARVVVVGINACMEQQDLAERIVRVSEAMKEDQGSISRQVGEQFPKMALNFMGGAVSGIRGIKTHSKIKSTRWISSQESAQEGSTRSELNGSTKEVKKFM